MSGLVRIRNNIAFARKVQTDIIPKATAYLVDADDDTSADKIRLGDGILHSLKSNLAEFKKLDDQWNDLLDRISDADKFDAEYALYKLHAVDNPDKSKVPYKSLMYDLDKAIGDVEAKVSLCKSDRIRKESSQVQTQSYTANPIVVMNARHVDSEKSLFSGNPIDFKAFLDDFNASVGSLTIPDVQKLSFLKDRLDGEAYDAVKMYSTADGYAKALERLKTRFGRKEDAVADLRRKIRIPLRNKSDYGLVRKVFDEFEYLITTLESYGIDIEDDQFVEYLENKLPEEVLMRISDIKRSLPASTVYNVTAMRKDVDRILLDLDRCRKLATQYSLDIEDETFLTDEDENPAPQTVAVVSSKRGKKNAKFKRYQKFSKDPVVAVLASQKASDMKSRDNKEFDNANAKQRDCGKAKVQLKENVEVRRPVAAFVDPQECQAIMTRNYEWLKSLNSTKVPNGKTEEVFNVNQVRDTQFSTLGETEENLLEPSIRVVSQETEKPKNFFKVVASVTKRKRNTQQVDSHTTLKHQTNGKIFSSDFNKIGDTVKHQKKSLNNKTLQRCSEGKKFIKDDVVHGNSLHKSSNKKTNDMMTIDKNESLVVESELDSAETYSYDEKSADIDASLKLDIVQEKEEITEAITTNVNPVDIQLEANFDFDAKKAEEGYAKITVKNEIISCFAEALMPFQKGFNSNFCPTENEKLDNELFVNENVNKKSNHFQIETQEVNILTSQFAKGLTMSYVSDGALNRPVTTSVCTYIYGGCTAAVGCKTEEKSPHTMQEPKRGKRRKSLKGSTQGFDTEKVVSTFFGKIEKAAGNLSVDEEKNLKSAHDFVSVIAVLMFFVKIIFFKKDKQMVSVAPNKVAQRFRAIYSTVFCAVSFDENVVFLIRRLNDVVYTLTQMHANLLHFFVLCITNRYLLLFGLRVLLIFSSNLITIIVNYLVFANLHFVYKSLFSLKLEVSVKEKPP